MTRPRSTSARNPFQDGRRRDGRRHIEWYLTEPGVIWLPKWADAHLSGRVRAVVVDERSTLAELDWAGVKVRPTFVGHRDVANAAGLLWDALTESTVMHRGQVELSRAVVSAKQRPMLGGQAFGWDRKAPGSSVLVAASLAWGVCSVTSRRGLDAAWRGGKASSSKPAPGLDLGMT